MATISANGSKGHHKFTLEVTETNYSIDNNTSNISFTFKLSPVVKNYDWYGWGSNISYTVTINGTSYTGTIPKYDGTSTVTLKSDTQTVNHENDGTKTINISFSVSDGAGQSYTPGNATSSGTMPLTTIPRASQITVNDANIGSATNIVINKASSGFTTTLYYKASGQGSFTKIVDKTSNQVYGWTVPTSFYSLIPNSKTIQCQFYAETYSGSTLVGTSSTVTATFTATGNPYFYNISRLDINNTTIALTGDNTKMVRYASNIEVSVDATGVNSSSIVSVTVNGTPISLTGSARKTGSIIIYSATTNQFVITATDSRGYTTTEVHTLTVVDYVPLTINTTIKRNTPTDGKVNISFSGNYFNGSFGSQSNTLTVQYRYKQSSSSSWGSWTSLTATKSGNTYSGSTQLSGLTYTNIYNFEIRAVDKVQTKTITGIMVSKGQPVYWWDDNGFNVNGNITLNDNKQSPWHLYKKTVDLSSLNQNTYYPVVSTETIPTEGLHRIIEAVSLDSGTVPNWSTHQQGFASLIDVLQVYPGWGTNVHTPIIISEDYNWSSYKPGWYNVLYQQSSPCFYLRGGGKYFLFTDWKTEWTIHTSSYTYKTSDTVAPTTTIGTSQGEHVAFKNEIPSTSTINGLIDTKLNTKIQYGTSLPGSADNGTIFLLYS